MSCPALALPARPRGVDPRAQVGIGPSGGLDLAVGEQRLLVPRPVPRPRRPRSPSTLPTRVHEPRPRARRETAVRPRSRRPAAPSRPALGWRRQKTLADEPEPAAHPRQAAGQRAQRLGPAPDRVVDTRRQTQSSASCWSVTSSERASCTTTSTRGRAATAHSMPSVLTSGRAATRAGGSARAAADVEHARTARPAAAITSSMAASESRLAKRTTGCMMAERAHRFMPEAGDRAGRIQAFHAALYGRSSSTSTGMFHVAAAARTTSAPPASTPAPSVPAPS